MARAALSSQPFPAGGHQVLDTPPFADVLPPVHQIAGFTPSRSSPERSEHPNTESERLPEDLAFGPRSKGLLGIEKESRGQVLRGAVVAPRVMACYPDALVVLGDRHISRGEARLWDQLHRLACDAGRERFYEQLPRQITFHCPAVTLAGLLGISDRHLARLARGLETAGLLDCGGHAQNIGGRSMYDGTLWAVLVAPGDEPPRIRAEDWRHNWRPDFHADVEGKTGAAAEMSELLRTGADEVEKYRAAKARAATPGAKNPPPLSSSDISPRPTLEAVIHGLHALWNLHASKRARAVGLLASQTAQSLGEPERRLYWCRVIWDALRSEVEERAGLQVLAAQFSRLQADLKEGAPWHNPGAVLAARLKT